MSDPLDLFLFAARSHAERQAVVEGEEAISYAAILWRVERLAAAIDHAQTDTPRVAIALPQGAWAYASMFASLMAGGFYAPINLDHPRELRARIVTSFEPHVIIALKNSDFQGLPVPDGCVKIAIDALGDERLTVARPPCDLAYVMFTSGSTGEPKGVMIPRGALAHYVSWAHQAMKVTPEDRWSQHPNIAFDLSVLDIYGALCAGACLYPLSGPKDRLLPAAAIRRHQLTIWNSVPSVINLIQRTGQLDGDHLASLRLVTFCGEPLLKEHLDGIFSVRPDLCVHNTYGPTETTVSLTLLRLDKTNYSAYCGSSVALGQPIPGMTILLEGSKSDSEGEIVIAGPQVARGYWRDPERTDAAFGIRRVEGKEQPSYRTGDWANFRDNNLYFTSRLDRQIKRNGHRIELGDIDAALRDAGAPAACTIYKDGALIAFVEGVSQDSIGGLMEAIRSRLPLYSIPDQMRTVETLPRNANDKIDAKALEIAVAKDRIFSECDLPLGNRNGI